MFDTSHEALSSFVCFLVVLGFKVRASYLQADALPLEPRPQPLLFLSKMSE
jgi:hypothetical protein